MTSRILLAAVAAIGLGAAAVPAHATLFSGTITLKDDTTGNPLNFSGTGTINWNLTTLNTWTHEDAVASYTLDPTMLGGYHDEIEMDLTFSLPSSQTVVHTGDATDVVFKFFGSVTSLGAITWDQPNPFYVDFTTGDQINLKLDGGIFGQSGYKDTGVLSVEVEQTKIPEPVSAALLGAGLIGIGAAKRSRKTAAA